MPSDPAAPTFQAISALPEIRDLIENAPDVLKADISRIKKLFAFTLQEAKYDLYLLQTHARQLARWRKLPISTAERAEVIRLEAIIPEIRPLIQRLIALATELDKRATTGTASPRKRWRH